MGSRRGVFNAKSSHVFGPRGFGDSDSDDDKSLLGLEGRDSRDQMKFDSHDGSTVANAKRSECIDTRVSHEHVSDFPETKQPAKTSRHQFEPNTEIESVEETMRVRDELSKALYKIILSTGRSEVPFELLTAEFEKAFRFPIAEKFKHTGWGGIFCFNTHPGCKFTVVRLPDKRIVVCIKPELNSEKSPVQNSKEVEISSSSDEEDLMYIPLKTTKGVFQHDKPGTSKSSARPKFIAEPPEFTTDYVDSKSNDTGFLPPSTVFGEKPHIEKNVSMDVGVNSKKALKSSTAAQLSEVVQNVQSGLKLKTSSKTKLDREMAIQVLCDIVDVNPGIQLSQLRVKFEEAAGEPLTTSKSEQLFGFKPATFRQVIDSLGYFKFGSDGKRLTVSMDSDYLRESAYCEYGIVPVSATGDEIDSDSDV